MLKGAESIRLSTSRGPAEHLRQTELVATQWLA